ncbi:MAG: aldo/keto reductase [Oscillospiraceae bacterium]|nr:aldo/keto reductase [Oscillospiraceae bacterium]
MQKVTLGRTGLAVTIAGLGCGGHSRLGLNRYGSEHAAGIVRHAYDLGVNFFDSSAAYGTQPALGQGLVGIGRDSYILSSKFPYKGEERKIKKAKELTETLESALKQLKTDYIDIYHLHALTQDDYDNALDEYMPVLENAKQQGKLRFIGVTEQFGSDTSHRMLTRAVTDNLFDVVMVGYNLLNPSAAKTILPLTMENNIGVLCMFAVRTALSDSERLLANLQIIDAKGQGGDNFSASVDILDFLRDEEGDIIPAAYRFCRHTKGIDVTLTGTSSKDHLQANLKSIQAEPLQEEIIERLNQLFANVDCVNAE